jgi:hypothetical protein
MKRNLIIAASIVAVIGVTGATAGLSAMATSLAGSERGPGAYMTSFGERHGGWGHRFGGRGGHGMAMLCSDRRDAKIAETIEFVESFVDFTPEQTEAWENLKVAVTNSSTKVDAACDKMKQAGRPDTVVEKLAFMEDMMSTGLSVLQEVRPAFDSFYAVLDDRQKKAVDKLLSRRHRRS